MSSSATIPSCTALDAIPVPSSQGGTLRRRRISPASGRALEILGHAIDYLADEFVHAGGALSACDPQVEAIQLLIDLNRQIYFACPELPTFAERLRAFLRLRPA